MAADPADAVPSPDAVPAPDAALDPGLGPDWAARREAAWWATPGVTAIGLDLPAEAAALVAGFRRAADVAPVGAQLAAMRELIDQLEAL